MRRLTMTRFALFLLLAGLLAAGCGGDNSEEDNGDAALKERARVAERTLIRIRDAVVQHYQDHGEAPENMMQLESLDEGAIETSEDYADVAYSFQNVEFNEDGEMTVGWFFATPRADSGAFKVRLNGATGEFDYTPHDQDYAPAESDNGWEE